MRGRFPSDVPLRPDDLAMLLVRLFQDGIRDDQELLSAAEKWFGGQGRTTLPAALRALGAALLGQADVQFPIAASQCPSSQPTSAVPEGEFVRMRLIGVRHYERCC
jgi:hypothetical protein